MATLNTILKDIKDIPVTRLEELSQFVHSLTPKSKYNAAMHKKILSFGGIFSDMSGEEYADFVKEATKSRVGLFNRSIGI